MRFLFRRASSENSAFRFLCFRPHNRTAYTPPGLAPFHALRQASLFLRCEVVQRLKGHRRVKLFCAQIYAEIIALYERGR